MNAPPTPPPRYQDETRDRARTRRLILDAAAGLGLVVALLIVLVIDTFRGPQRSDEAPTEVVLEATQPVASEPKRLRLAVTPPEFDDMGRLLDTLGHGYQYETASFREFLTPGALQQHDVVFLTCGGVPTDWLSERLRDSERGTAGVYRPKPETIDSLYKNIRQFVRGGGALYVSDLHFDVLAIAFPEFIDDDTVGRGAVQTIEARVVEEGLRKQLGDQIALRFDMKAWRPAAFKTHKVTTYLEGEYRLIDGPVRSGPLLVRFPYGKGTVVFTSFHNEAQNNDLETLLLRYLVFATVTARQDENVRQVLVKGGFSPRQRNLLALSTEQQPKSDSYNHPSRGPLQFVLGFENSGAELKLTVTAPGGKRFEKSGRETFSISVEQAETGRWTYTITPARIPYRNFPFTLTIAEKTDGKSPEEQSSLVCNL